MPELDLRNDVYRRPLQTALGTARPRAVAGSAPTSGRAAGT